MPGAPLTDKQEAFCREYLVDLCGSKAAVRAGYSAKCAKQQADILFNDPRIKARVESLIAEREKRVEFTADEVLHDLADMWRADVNDVCELRRTCCRHCHGEGFLYQRTSSELERDRKKHRIESAKREEKGEAPLAEFQELGGEGYDARRDPVEDCPECFGEGVERAFFKDTRKLKGGALKLFSGIKQTRDGFEIKLLDRAKLFELAMKHFGMLIDRKELSGPNGGPIPIDKPLEDMTEDELDLLLARAKTRESAASS